MRTASVSKACMKRRDREQKRTGERNKCGFLCSVCWRWGKAPVEEPPEPVLLISTTSDSREYLENFLGGRSHAYLISTNNHDYQVDPCSFHPLRTNATTALLSDVVCLLASPSPADSVAILERSVSSPPFPVSPPSIPAFTPPTFAVATFSSVSHLSFRASAPETLSGVLPPKYWFGLALCCSCFTPFPIHHHVGSFSFA